jgi:pyruvate dehydrogenase E2 component (dihydrolipoyllysine-residue acetyltransferase)
MSIEIIMPRLSDSMEEGTVVEWLKRVGDEVTVGEPLVEIETDKATMSYEADDAGTLLEIIVPDGDTAALGAVIARLGDPAELSAVGAAAPAAAKQGEANGSPPPPVAEQPAANGSPPPPVAPATAAPPLPAERRPGERIDASPVARRLAQELGVELATVPGTGPRGRIMKADVQAAHAERPATAGRNGAPQEPVAIPSPAAGPPPAPAPPPPAASRPGVAPPPAAAPPSAGPDGGRGTVDLAPLSRIQQTVARRMAESRATIPEFTLFRDVDMGACVELRAQLKGLSETAPSYNDMVVKATALALRGHPRANAAYRDGGIEVYGRINVGIAVAREEGLVVPTIFDADTKSLGEIARESRRLAEAVRDATITPPELAGGTFSVTNLGMLGIDAFTAIINPGQAAILSVGRMAKRPVATATGDLTVRDVITLGIVADHRVLNGADAALFLASVTELLEQPLRMAL